MINYVETGNHFQAVSDIFGKKIMVDKAFTKSIKTKQNLATYQTHTQYFKVLNKNNTQRNNSVEHW